MMRKILALLMLSLPFLSFAGSDADVVKELKLRNLIVQLLEEDAAIVKKLSKEPAKLQTYQKNIQNSNSLIKKVVGKYWKLHSSPLFKTKSEIAQMKVAEEQKKKKERLNYAVMSMDFFSERVKTREESAVDTDKMYTGDANYLYLRFWEGVDIVYTSIPHVIPTEADLVYAVRYLFNQVSGMEYDKDITALCKENAPQIRNKTLLLTSWQASELTDKDWQKEYPYPHKIVSESEIAQAIINADPKFAVIVYSDQSDTVVLKTMILTDTGQFAGYVTGIKRTPLSKKDLKELVQYSN